MQQESSKLLGRDDSMKVHPMTSPPYKWICVIEWKTKELTTLGTPENPRRGTGFKINFPHVDYSVVITAAHVLWDKKYPEKVILKFPGEGAFEVPKSNFFTPNEYTNEKEGRYDYGLIFYQKGSNPSDGFGWTTQIKERQLRHDNIIVCGFPAQSDTFHLPIENLEMSIAGGTIKGVKDYTLQYYNDTKSGQSGSPLYLCHEGICWTVIGIHVAGGESYNSGRSLDLEIIAQFARVMNCQKALQSALKSRSHLFCKPYSAQWGNVTCQLGLQRHSDKFIIYPVAMPPSLSKIEILQKFVIESVRYKHWFFSAYFTHYMLRLSKEESLYIQYFSNCCKVSDKEMFYLRKEYSDSIYSFISAEKPHYRICMDITSPTFKTLNLCYYETAPKSTNSEPYKKTDETLYPEANMLDKIKIMTC